MERIEETMKEKNAWVREAVKLVKSPLYFCYWLGLLLVYVLPYQNFVWANEAMNVLSGEDSFGYLLARGFGDFFGSFLVVFPVFVVATARYRDLREKNNVPSEDKGWEEPPVLVRFFLQVAFLFLPVVILAVVAAVRLQAPSTGGTEAISFADRLRFLQIAFVWLLPVIMAVTAVAQLVSDLFRNALTAILLQLVIWVFTVGSTAEVGDYNSCLAIRHSVTNVLEHNSAYEAFASNMNGLLLNRGIVVLLSLGLLLLTRIIHKKRTHS